MDVTQFCSNGQWSPHVSVSSIVKGSPFFRAGFIQDKRQVGSYLLGTVCSSCKFH